MPTGTYKRKPHSEETKIKISKALQDKNNPMYGKTGKSSPNYKHGGYNTRLYKIWRNMIDRCHNPKNPHYSRRGIKVCDKWKNSYIAFRDFALSHGYKDNLTIDRINNDGNYEPSNCQFITQSENSKKQFKKNN